MNEPKKHITVNVDPAIEAIIDEVRVTRNYSYSRAIELIVSEWIDFKNQLPLGVSSETKLERINALYDRVSGML